MIAEYDVRTKTESIRRHRKIILEETFSGGFDTPKMETESPLSNDAAAGAERKNVRLT